ncbi:PTS mannitol transporter subunit IICBA [Fusobacterium mortiferum]|uniref:PTS mannitol transporter subunit IICBA n=1 Tax=Fusobacterium mortiferum TaxID=850 RepID=UPI001F1F92FE|nr:PTS mannitol transporter subunit IICBA [Fusobacterium mortiferum]MCF2699925.1 PTS mannitol transporter subunit IICBA [Fusobacterium mortiferum]
MENKTSLKIYVQSFGRFLSGMVMPNIGAFIAWGIATALFIPTGWLPNEELAKLISPMLTYLLPLLIGYSGGKLVAGERGGIIGAITTAGVIVGTTIPMFIGAMIAGPVAGYVIKKFDKVINGKVKSGFEMLINNFSIGILGIILAIVFFKAIGPLVQVANEFLGNGVNTLVKLGLLPITSILVEPAKVLFLNNAINHGVFSPLGIQQVSETGKSIFFLIEANPGPGLGVLLAYIFFSKGSSKESASGAAIIHFFGGIHEIYFPYILMKPFLIIAVIFGGMAGVFTNVVLNSGLIAPPSPGSVFAIMALAPKGGLLKVLASIVVATVVSFVISSIIIKSSKDELGLEEAQKKMKDLKNSKANKFDITKDGISKIVVACDAGMGSSAMGASVLRKKVNEAGLNIEVTNCSISNLTEDIDIVITHKDLTPRAKTVVSQPLHLSIDNFMNGSFYDELVEKLKNNKNNSSIKTSKEDTATEDINNKFNLEKKAIILNKKSVTKEEALKDVGSYMAELGYVKPNYTNYILEREKQSTTYLGNYVAIPHGTVEGKQEIEKTGIVIFQYPEGIDFGNGNIAYFLIGIAAKSNEHIEIISHLSDVIEDEEEVLKLKEEKDIEKLYKIFSF